MADAANTENPELHVDLVSQTIKRPNGADVSFDIDPFRKQCLLEGLDDIELTLEKVTVSHHSDNAHPSCPGYRVRRNFSKQIWHGTPYASLSRS